MFHFVSCLPPPHQPRAKEFCVHGESSSIVRTWMSLVSYDGWNNDIDEERGNDGSTLRKNLQTLLGVFLGCFVTMNMKPSAFSRGSGRTLLLFRCVGYYRPRCRDRKPQYRSSQQVHWPGFVFWWRLRPLRLNNCPIEKKKSRCIRIDVSWRRLKSIL